MNNHTNKVRVRFYEQASIAVRGLFFIRTIYKNNNILKISQITRERSFALDYLMMKSLTYFVTQKE